jgi:hypothetical protein
MFETTLIGCFGGVAPKAKWDGVYLVRWGLCSHSPNSQPAAQPPLRLLWFSSPGVGSMVPSSAGPGYHGDYLSKMEVLGGSLEFKVMRCIRQRPAMVCFTLKSVEHWSWWSRSFHDSNHLTLGTWKTNHSSFIAGVNKEIDKTNLKNGAHSHLLISSFLPVQN